jgi:hypothetical protein
MAKRTIKRLPAKICDFCENEFLPKKTWQRFCSISCHGRFWTAARVHPDDRFVTVGKQLAALFRRVEALESSKISLK